MKASKRRREEDRLVGEVKKRRAQLAGLEKGSLVWGTVHTKLVLAEDRLREFRNNWS